MREGRHIWHPANVLGLMLSQLLPCRDRWQRILNAPLLCLCCWADEGKLSPGNPKVGKPDDGQANPGHSGCMNTHKACWALHRTAVLALAAIPEAIFTRVWQDPAHSGANHRALSQSISWLHPARVQSIGSVSGNGRQQFSRQ